jgi:uncharacterized membrane protein
MMGVTAMIVMLIVLVPLAILFAYAVVHDLRRRRRHTPAVDMESRAAALKASAHSKGAVSGGDSGGGVGGI